MPGKRARDHAGECPSALLGRRWTTGFIDQLIADARLPEKPEFSDVLAALIHLKLNVCWRVVAFMMHNLGHPERNEETWHQRVAELLDLWDREHQLYEPWLRFRRDHRQAVGMLTLPRATLIMDSVPCYQRERGTPQDCGYKERALWRTTVFCDRRGVPVAAFSGQHARTCDMDFIEQIGPKLRHYHGEQILADGACRTGNHMMCPFKAKRRSKKQLKLFKIVKKDTRPEGIKRYKKLWNAAGWAPRKRNWNQHFAQERSVIERTFRRVHNGFHFTLDNVNLDAYNNSAMGFAVSVTKYLMVGMEDPDREHTRVHGKTICKCGLRRLTPDERAAMTRRRLEAFPPVVPK
jgi:hypothetical protein